MKSGKAASERTTTLGSRDLAILRFVGNFRLTNADILYRKFFEDLKIDAMKSTLRRLIGKRPRYLFLRPQRLDGNRVIYLLTARGTVLAGVPKSFARSVRQVPLFENMAVLRFIHSEGGPP